MNKDMFFISLSLVINSHCYLCELKVKNQEVGTSERKNDKQTQQR